VSIVKNAAWFEGADLKANRRIGPSRSLCANRRRIRCEGRFNLGLIGDCLIGTIRLIGADHSPPILSLANANLAADNSPVTTTGSIASDCKILKKGGKVNRIKE
jgi:hypothetical protein